MADEIAFSRSGNIVGTNFTDSVAARVTNYDLGANEKFDNVIPLTTTEVDLTFINVTTPKLCILENIGTSGSIQIGPKSGGAMVEFTRLQVLEEAIFPVGSGVTIRVRMVSGTGSLRARVWG
jgi:hypothetical protein